MEIDLGDEVRSRNALMTERATRRLQGVAETDEQEAGPANKKVRLGRDGKPWRPRNQRGSDAIKRDQLVEDILKESRRTLLSPLLPPREVTCWLTNPQLSMFTKRRCPLR